MEARARAVEGREVHATRAFVGGVARSLRPNSSPGLRPMNCRSPTNAKRAAGVADYASGPAES
jgi:hypothetical protein